MINNSTATQQRSGLFQRFTKFMQSGLGVAAVAIFYLILHLPVELSSDALRYMAGEVAAKLMTTAIVVFVLARFFKWTANQKILALFLLAFLFEIMQSQPLLAPFARIIFLLSIPTLIIQSILESRKRKEAKHA